MIDVYHVNKNNVVYYAYNVEYILCLHLVNVT